MHVHANQVNPYVQQDALYAAQKAAAKRDAANTRRKLMTGDFDSEEAGVAKLEANQESQQQTKRQNSQKQGSRKKPNETAESEQGDRSISEWG
jgi:hypothetical protein